MDLTELMNSDLFYHGPKWLTNKNTKFQNVGEMSDEEVSLDSDELKKAFQMQGPHVNVLFASLDEEDDVIKDILERHKNWRKSVNVIAWIRRFWTNFKNKVDQQKQNKNNTATESRKMTLRNKTKTKQKKKIQIK